jgi:hypothetical protein
MEMLPQRTRRRALPMSPRALKVAMRALQPVPVDEPVNLAGTDDHGVRTLKIISLAREQPGELKEGDVVPAGAWGCVKPS